MYYIFFAGEYTTVAIDTSNLQVAETIMGMFKKKHKIQLNYKLEKYPSGDISDMENETVLEVPSTIKILVEDAVFPPSEVIEMSPKERLQKVLEWEGIVGYTNQILNWVNDYVDMGGNLNEGYF